MQDDFELTDDTLKIFIDLDLDAESIFQEWCDKLIALKSKRLYLDLSEVGFVGSAFFGQMFMLNYQIKKSGRSLILRVPSHLMSIMELLGLPQLLEIETVNRPRPPATTE